MALGRQDQFRPWSTLAVVAAGISASLHLGKLAPALPALRATLQLDVVEAGFLLSLVQLAGMLFGVFFGSLADTIGPRRSMLAGLIVLSIASALSAAMGDSSLPARVQIAFLFCLRAAEGLGFLLTVMPAPRLIRAVTPASAEKAAFGLWGSYMPFGVATALLFGPFLIGQIGWPGWWLVLSLLSAALAIWVWICVPEELTTQSDPRGPAMGKTFTTRLKTTMKSQGPWLLAIAFAVYSFQWIAVIGFLPSIYAEAAVAAGLSAILTAVAAAMNILGNLAGGVLLQRNTAPSSLLKIGYAIMAIGGIIAFGHIELSAVSGSASPLWQYLAICAFSLGGGVIPVTLFSLAVRVSPDASTVSTSVGLLQQGSSLGQFVGPPVVGWVASQAGGWQFTWLATVPCCLVGLVVATRLAARSLRESNW